MKEGAFSVLIVALLVVLASQWILKKMRGAAEGARLTTEGRKLPPHRCDPPPPPARMHVCPRIPTRDAATRHSRTAKLRSSLAATLEHRID